MSVMVINGSGGRAAMALNACAAGDIVKHEGANCPAGGDACTITKTYVVGDNCTLDFGTRAVTLSGVLDVNSGAMIFMAGSLTINPTGILDARGDGVAPATGNGGSIGIKVSDAVNVDRLNSARGRIDVSGTDQAGSIEINAGGSVTIAGYLAAAQLTSSGTGGAIRIRSGGNIVSLAISIISATGGRLGEGGGTLDFGATGKIDLGDTIEVSGDDGGTVTLNAGDLVNIQQIKAYGIGDGAAGGSVAISAGAAVQIFGTMGVQGAPSSDPSGGAGDGGVVSVEANSGDLQIAATINTSGAAPDGDGGTIDLTAQGAITLQSGRLNARCNGTQGAGGRISVRANLALTSNVTVDASSGIGPGEVNMNAGSAVTLNGFVDVSSHAAAGTGGSFAAEAGGAGLGTLIINNTVDVTGGSCAEGGPCGIGGRTDLEGCNVIVATAAVVKAGAPVAGENHLTAHEQLTINGRVSAARTVSTGTDGRNVFVFPTRKSPVIAANSVTPAAQLAARGTCTVAGDVDCLIPCPTCGNGIVEYPETCDDGLVGSTKSCDGCSTFCKIENCNDGQVCTIDSCDPRLGCRSVPVTSPCTEPPTATPTVTPTATLTPTVSPTPTVSNTPTITPTPTDSPPPLATLSASPTPTATAVKDLAGDGNCDGRVTAADLVAVVMMLGHETSQSCPLGDFNNDGVIDGVDLSVTILLEFPSRSGDCHIVVCVMKTIERRRCG